MQGLLGLILSQEGEEKVPAPILQVKALGTGDGHEKGSSRDIGLEGMLFLAKGARVILLENLWGEMGLVNGALGIIEDIAWDAGIYLFIFPFFSVFFSFFFSPFSPPFFSALFYI